MMMNYDLFDYSLLKVAGTDAFKLLQGQLTCDLSTVTENQTQLAAHCNPQGRIISLFHLFTHNAAYYLLMKKSMIQIAESALKKYAVFYKVTIVPCEDLPICGADSMDTDAISLRYANTNRFLLLKSATETGNDWHTTDINALLPTLHPETSGLFLPHELNLISLNAVSFNKGCFTGQEIIARMEYRGKAKKQMYLAEVRNSQPIAAGNELVTLINDQYQSCGQVVDVAGDTDQCRLLILMKPEDTARPLAINDTSYTEVKLLKE